MGGGKDKKGKENKKNDRKTLRKKRKQFEIKEKQKNKWTKIKQ